jgi:aspartate aminotransferase
MKLSARIQSIPDSPTLAIDAKAKALKASGADVVFFSAGEPDFNTPETVIRAAQRALDEGQTKYTPVPGTPALKAAIRDYYKRRTGFEFGDAEIIASCGAKHSLYNLFLALLDPGDEVIIPAPYWVSYPAQVEIAEGNPVIVTGDPANDFVPSIDALEAAVTPRTRAIIINNPSNPTGALWRRPQLEQLAKWLESHPQIVVVSDAIYDELVYDGEEYVELLSLAPSLRDRYFIINGVSKAFAMTGWRLGYAIGPKDAVAAMSRLQSQSTSNPAAVTQAASVEALKQGEAIIAPMREKFAARRNLIASLIRAIPGVSLVEPRGAFYAFPDVSAYIGKKAGDRVITDDVVLAEYLLESVAVAVVPGTPSGAPGYIRLAYGTSEDRIREGIARISKALAALV